MIRAIGKSFRARGGRGCGCAPSSLWQSAAPKRVKDVWDSIILEQDADGCTAIAVGALYDYVDRIREALGVSE